MSFPRYAAYKDSGVELMGEVPTHWGIWKLGHAFTQIGSGTTPKSDNAEYYEDGRIPWVNTGDLNDGPLTECAKCITEKAAEDHSTLKLYPAGSLLFAMYGATIGKLGILKFPATVNQACCVFSGESPITVRFMFFWFLGLRQKILSLATGGGQPNVSQDILRTLRVACPNKIEQHAIASFLDRETSKIDSLVAEQRRLVELLKEKRQAVISHAVTKGLDPTVPMKPSGIDWVGDVPKHWEVTTLKRGITKIGQGFSPQCHSEPASDDEWGVVKVGCCNKFDLNETEQKRLPLEIEPVIEYEVQNGDILMSRGNTLDLVGMASLVKNVRSRLLLCDLVYRFRTHHDTFDPAFLVHSIRSKSARSQIECNAVGSSSTMKKISQELVRNLLVCRPPLDEQQEISKRLATMAIEFNSLIAEAERAISLLQERRTALISAAVTGKIDVRKVSCGGAGIAEVLDAGA